MIITLITDGEPYIFENVSYVSIDRDGTLFDVEHAEDFVLEDTPKNCAGINVDRLIKRLNITLDCKSCPRYTGGGYSYKDKCRGHLQWLCNGINEVLKNG